MNPNKETTMKTEADQPQKTDIDNELRVAEHMAKRRREDLVDACRRAVECLERFAAEARRELERAPELDPTRLVALPGEGVENDWNDVVVWLKYQRNMVKMAYAYGKEDESQLGLMSSPVYGYMDTAARRPLKGDGR